MTEKSNYQVIPICIQENERHIIAFSEEAIKKGLSVDYQSNKDILVHVKIKIDRGVCVINDYIDGKWRTQCAVPLKDPNSRPLINLIFNSAGITVFASEEEMLLFRSKSIVNLDLEIIIPNNIKFERQPAKEGMYAVPAESEAAGFPKNFLVGDDNKNDQALEVETTPSINKISENSFPRSNALGHLDFYAEISDDLWVFCGWSKERWSVKNSAQMKVTFENGEQEYLKSPPFIWYDRPDLNGNGTGILMVVSNEADKIHQHENPIEIEIYSSEESYRLLASRHSQHPSPIQAAQWARDIISRAVDGDTVLVRSLITRPIYTGIDTIGSLPVPFHFEVDEVIAVGTSGFFILGWMLDPQEAVADIRLRAGRSSSSELRTRWISVERVDVRDAFLKRYDLADARCGFIAYCEINAPDGRGLHVEVVINSGEIAFKPIPSSTRNGASAIRRILGGLRLTRDEMQHAFDAVLGPPLLELNRIRLAKPLSVSEIAFGTPPKSPRCSIIVPLYGRMDFIEYQCALFSETSLPVDEIIYVLDEPSKKSMLLDLAQIVYAKFGVPFRILLPTENRGFGPASNLGLGAATGQYVCFLNSDVFPRDANWLDKMIESLESESEIGIVGGLLLFADGSVQHSGLDYEAIPQFANWYFPTHPGKGMRPSANGPRLINVPGVTGACMVLQRELATSLKGFDLDYVIGDFEDADLCHRINSLGLKSVVDREAVLYHLERQSQGDQSQSWRMYLTLLNAWTHDRRWRHKLLD